uniref:Uncharacterized protein n=1 Tax=Ditylenchus dipsaci TaxID=166011 RepID=A0A915E6Q3_9BILA
MKEEEEEAEVQQSDNHTTTNTKKHQKSSEKEHSHETANKFHDRSSKNHIPDIFPPHPPKPPLLKHKSALSTPLIIAIVATLVFAAPFILFLIVKKIRSKKHKDAILDMAKPHGPNTYVSMDGSKISANNLSAPNANPWIMSQDEVTVFFDQKLGSGVGGNVFKGKINGKAAVLNVFPKLVAINKFRDCDVAVKILPAFADSNANFNLTRKSIS